MFERAAATGLAAGAKVTTLSFIWLKAVDAVGSRAILGSAAERAGAGFACEAAWAAGGPKVTALAFICLKAVDMLGSMLGSMAAGAGGVCGAMAKLVFMDR